MCFAEECSHAIQVILKKFGADFRRINTEEPVCNINSPGVYVLWFVMKKEFKKLLNSNVFVVVNEDVTDIETEWEAAVRFPVYVGSTSRPLEDRLNEHISGKLREFTYGLNTVDNSKIFPLGTYAYISYVPTSSSVALLLEALFLKEFNFFFNVKQNGPRREFNLDYLVAVERKEDIFIHDIENYDDKHKKLKLKEVISFQVDAIVRFFELLKDDYEILKVFSAGGNFDIWKMRVA
ncbi:hypothetical protein ACUHMQ_20120 [Chitinimonas sp. PSY-7]|uniref:hypothetical protein n=1 Tax=Chitinimonas sp. PSY-7 TaxID=3459088 RepID=UPI0040403CF8